MNTYVAVLLVGSFCLLQAAVVKINVCVRLEFLTTNSNNELPKAPPPLTLKVRNGTNTHNILRQAAKLDSRYAFTTKAYSFGNMVTSISGVHQDHTNSKYWMIYSDPNTLTPTGIDHYRPKDGSCVIFKYEKLSLV
ncbi:uncharacterized protein CG3556-like [Actinia tenebrosa]|uniref:Uncharacterized protein CG3556-like n=1 Tax=Actinia tenebrosa TaxID=6105 RepID=A0A6P8HQS4_ACTTE|nr:uncharacterized protein CG3556-like [Actinia tenebrosa]